MHNRQESESVLVGGKRFLRAQARPYRVLARNRARRARSFAIHLVQSVSPGDIQLPGRCLPMCWFNGEANFGDALSPLVMESGLKVRPIWVPPDHRNKVLFIGSVMNALRPGDLVIGTGVIRARAVELPDGATVVGVRGPRTLSALGLRHKIPFGDPGLLAAEATGIARSVSNGRVAIAPHYVDTYSAQSLLAGSKALRDQCVILDICARPERFMTELSRYDACVSSSLHGLIAAHSLGIPAVAVALGDSVVGGAFKFHDYFEGIGWPFGGLSNIRSALGKLEQSESHIEPPSTDPVRRMIEHAQEVLVSRG